MPLIKYTKTTLAYMQCFFGGKALFNVRSKDSKAALKQKQTLTQFEAFWRHLHAVIFFKKYDACAV